MNQYYWYYVWYCSYINTIHIIFSIHYHMQHYFYITATVTLNVTESKSPTYFYCLHFIFYFFSYIWQFLFCYCIIFVTVFLMFLTLTFKWFCCLNQTTDRMWMWTLVSGVTFSSLCIPTIHLHQPPGASSATNKCSTSLIQEKNNKRTKTLPLNIIQPMNMLPPQRNWESCLVVYECDL